jgi:hypothetical protein
VRRDAVVRLLSRAARQGRTTQASPLSWWWSGCLLKRAPLASSWAARRSWSACGSGRRAGGACSLLGGSADSLGGLRRSTGAASGIKSAAWAPRATGAASGSHWTKG